MAVQSSIAIATSKSWNISKALELRRKLAPRYLVEVVESPEKLLELCSGGSKLEFIFFPHWSWKIPSSVYDSYECVVFHMTDLPFGRGGSPLQNLIERKIYSTKISALKVCEGIDAGPVYCKSPFDISKGSAQEILQRASEVVFERMIPDILEKRPQPQPQQGEAITFSRRKPSQSNLLDLKQLTLSDFYDFVRMLDGEGYPPAFIKIGGVKIVFRAASISGDSVTGTFEVTNEED